MSLAFYVWALPKQQRNEQYSVMTIYIGLAGLTVKQINTWEPQASYLFLSTTEKAWNCLNTERNWCWLHKAILTLTIGNFGRSPKALRVGAYEPSVKSGHDIPILVAKHETVPSKVPQQTIQSTVVWRVESRTLIFWKIRKRFVISLGLPYSHFHTWRSVRAWVLGLLVGNSWAALRRWRRNKNLYSLIIFFILVNRLVAYFPLLPKPLHQWKTLE